jgi:DNA modification methylase
VAARRSENAQQLSFDPLAAESPARSVRTKAKIAGLGISSNSVSSQLVAANLISLTARSSDSQNLRALHARYAANLVVNPDLTRALVSFQANKIAPFYRWLKYKEAFSSEFVCYVLNRFCPQEGSLPRVLDPFAGAGTTLTTATKCGWRATGIELLPVGTAAMKARVFADTVDLKRFDASLRKFHKIKLNRSKPKWQFPHLRITNGAFRLKTQQSLERYVDFVNRIGDDQVRHLFWFAALSILEDISFTRKDGQYLRWDARSGRRLKSNFDKGNILDFETAILSKLDVLRRDLQQRNGGAFSRNVEIMEGSCLDKMHDLPDSSIDLVITSPPYCNRYDYTRTYALELAFMGFDEERLKDLRQNLLSATVENKSKRKALASDYARRGKASEFEQAIMVFDSQEVLNQSLGILKEARERRELNNSNIPTMVENYFFEMNLVVRQIARVLKSKGRVVLVNDNVQYHGLELPVDLILSDFAEHAGLTVEAIWVLSRGKGNSSQQMGTHGRNELRKCVYVWSKK